jgi:hypothetical protein
MSKSHFALHTRAAAAKKPVAACWPLPLPWSAGVGFQPYTPPHDPSQGKWGMFGLEILRGQNDALCQGWAWCLWASVSSDAPPENGAEPVWSIR